MLALAACERDAGLVDEGLGLSPVPPFGAGTGGTAGGTAGTGAGAGTGGVAGTSGGSAGTVAPPAAGVSGDVGVAGVSGGFAGISGGTAGTSGSEPLAPGELGPMRDVVMVANSVSGTISFLDAYTFENLGSVDAIPDYDEVMGLITLDLIRFIAYPIVKQNQLLHHFEPSGGDRFLDDVFVSPDGTRLYVSRSNLGDVAAFDLTKPNHPRLWRTFVDGTKADHATLSPDGKTLVVSATSVGKVNVFDATTGMKTAEFAGGTFPHQNDYTPDGKYVYNSSIGNVGYNVYSYERNAEKGDRWLLKVDASTWQVAQKWEFEWGIRPNVFTPDEHYMYAQLSYLNGVIKYDLTTGQEVGRSDQPLSDFALQTYATYDEYPHDSAHHGLAMSGDGTRLCDCGTIDNTVAIVRTGDMQVESMIDVGMVPYWATTGPDGTHCFVSLSGGDAISVIDYETGTQVAEVPVGKFPQRNRVGRVPQSVIDGLLPSGG